MADQLAIFLQSRFDSAGVSSAEKALSGLNQKVSELKSHGRLFDLQPQDYLGRSQEALKALDAEIASLKEIESLNKRAAQGAKLLGNELASKVFTQRAQMAGSEIKAAEGLLTAEDRLKLALDRSNTSHETSIPLIQNRVKQLQKEAKSLREAAAAEASRGKTGAAQSLLNQASAQDRAAKSLENLTDRRFIDTGVTDEQNKKNQVQSMLMNVLSSKFNQLGFTMFVTASTARMFFQAFEAGFNVFAEGAAVLDRQNAFNQLLSGGGIDPSGLINKLQKASQGTVPLDLAIRKSLQLAKAGFPEIAAKSDKLLAIAVNSAKVSGELDQVETIYDKLIRGIIRGSPRLIDDADIILKLGDANEKYAESLGKTVEGLTAAEKVQATFSAVITEGDRINQMAEDVESAAIEYQQLRTAVTDAGNAIKETLAISAANIGEGGLTAFLGDFAETTRLGNQVTQIIQDIKEEDESLALTLQQTSLNLAENKEAWKIWAKALVNGTLSERDLNEILEATQGKAKLTGEELLNLVQTLVDVQQEANSADRAMFNFLETLDGPTITVFDDTINKGVIADFQTKALEAGLAFIDVQEKMIAAEQKFGETMTKLRYDMSEKMITITQELTETLTGIDESYYDILDGIDQDLADKREDIQQDLAEKLEDISDDAQEKRVSEYQKHTTKMEDIEQDHQKRIAEIMQQFEMSRMKALIDRDALALFEAERSRDQDLQDAQQTATEKRQTEIDEYRKTTQELDQEEQKRRQQAQEDADRQRRDAEIARERARRDAKEDYEQQLKDAQDAAEKQRAAAIKDYAQQQRDAIENYAEQRDALDDWYDDMLHDQEEAALNRRFQELMNQEEEYGRTKEWFDDLKELYEDFNQFTEQNTPTYPSPNGDTPPSEPPPTNAPGPNTDGTDTIIGGAYCNVPSGMSYTGADGQQYLCVNRVWTLVSEVFPSSNSGGGTASAGGVATASGVLGSPSGAQQVTIRVQGDSTLEEIFKNISYEAVIEVLS